MLLGGKAISDERRRIIARRQAEAKAAVRRYVDEVAFQVGKDSREMLRVVQRDLRDHYSAARRPAQPVDPGVGGVGGAVGTGHAGGAGTAADRDRQELSALGALRATSRRCLLPADSSVARADPVTHPRRCSHPSPTRRL